jgi:carbon-monoxide dehydrogenase medium subunit
MPNINLLHPSSLNEAVSLLSEQNDETKIVSGGTALVIMLRNRLIAPTTLLSLGRLKELRSIRHEPGTGLRIGALVTIREAETSPLVRERHSVLAQTFGKVGNVRVRNAATVGGNLSEADYASDPPCVLVALRARVKAQSAKGEREIPLTDFFKGFYETALAPDEILTELIVPDQAPGSCATYLKYVSRSSEDRPCVGMAVVLENDSDGTCKDLRLVAGAVSEIPQEIVGPETTARGKHLSDSLIEAIADAYSRGIEPLSDLRGSAWYRQQIIRVMARRAMQQVLGGKLNDPRLQAEGF